MCQCRESSVGGILVGCEGITQKQITSLKRKINRLGEAEPTFTTSKLAWCLGLLCFSAGLELRGGFCFRSSLEPVGLLNWCQEAQNRECRVSRQWEGWEASSKTLSFVYCVFVSRWSWGLPRPLRLR